MPFELRNIAIDRDRCFTDQFEIVDFLGRYTIQYYLRPVRIATTELNWQFALF